MLKRLSSSVVMAALVAAVAVPASAETLLVERVQQERGAALPARGMSMAQVERTFGAPASRLDPRGGDAPTHPVINRWVYPNFTVYFERDHVIDAVVNRATASELGPKSVDEKR